MVLFLNKRDILSKWAPKPFYITWKSQKQIHRFLHRGKAEIANPPPPQMTFLPYIFLQSDWLVRLSHEM